MAEKPRWPATKKTVRLQWLLVGSTVQLGQLKSKGRLQNKDLRGITVEPSEIDGGRETIVRRF